MFSESTNKRRLGFAAAAAGLLLFVLIASLQHVTSDRHATEVPVALKLEGPQYCECMQYNASSPFNWMGIASLQQATVSGSRWTIVQFDVRVVGHPQELAAYIVDDGVDGWKNAISGGANSRDFRTAWPHGITPGPLSSLRGFRALPGHVYSFVVYQHDLAQQKVTGFSEARLGISIDGSRRHYLIKSSTIVCGGILHGNLNACRAVADPLWLNSAGQWRSFV